MKLELTDQEFRYLLDLVYIGNWVLNSTRGDDRIEEYDQVEGKVFSHCVPQGMPKLVERYRGSLIPVSYTHLDVYKRQYLRIMRLSGSLPFFL